MRAREALEQHGSHRKAAQALGIAKSTFQDRLKKEAYDLPAGHVLRGESALVDNEGNVKLRWVKTREGGGEALIEGLRDALTGIGAAPVIDPPTISDADTLTVYPIPDLHFGMYSWGEETGADYDTDIATKLALGAVGSLVSRAAPSRHAVILGLGDLFHQNDQKNMTPRSGHGLDVDGRWARVFRMGCKLMLELVRLVATKHDTIDVVILPGNHDEDAAVCLRVTIELCFADNPRIRVCTKPGLHWFHRFGSCLLGATHGHTMKPDRMAMMMAADRPKDWGETEFRYMFFGHVHHDSMKEVGPVKVESFNTPAARDAYAAGGGYRSGRAMNAITYHATDGEISRHRVNILSPNRLMVAA